jgi:hypothetical protein
VLRSETQFVLAGLRTQVFNPADLDNVKKVQAGYRVQPLSAFLGQPAAAAAPRIDFFKPLSSEEQKSSLAFFSELNFILQSCPTVRTEVELMARFAKLGIGGGKSFDPDKLPPEIRQAVADGIEDAWKAFAELKAQSIDTGKVTAADVFGTRQFLKNNYLYRMAAAVLGIYGVSREEALYPIYSVDSDGQRLDASTHRYTLRFASSQLPPAKAFWSLTMYELPASLLVANPINRYLINSPMLPDLRRDANGGISLYIQNESPGADKESNWLPAPKGPFVMFMRMYLPEPEAIDGSWKRPPLKRELR